MNDCFSSLVSDLDFAYLASFSRFSHLNAILDPSRADLKTDLAFTEWSCSVDEIGEESARLILRKVASAQNQSVYCVNAAWVE